jgi:hypothetical protein
MLSENKTDGLTDQRNSCHFKTGLIETEQCKHKNDMTTLRKVVLPSCGKWYDHLAESGMTILRKVV